MGVNIWLSIVRFLLVLYLASFLIISFSLAEVRLDMPNTLTEVIPYRVTLVVNEPSLQKYTDDILIQCSHCKVMIDEEDQSKEYGHSKIELRGRDRVSFFIVGEFDEREKERTGTLSSIKFHFTGDIE